MKGSHLLKVRNMPPFVHRVAGKAAPDVIINAASCHVFQREFCHGNSCLCSTPSSDKPCTDPNARSAMQALNTRPTGHSIHMSHSWHQHFVRRDRNLRARVSAISKWHNECMLTCFRIGTRAFGNEGLQKDQVDFGHSWEFRRPGEASMLGVKCL